MLQNNKFGTSGVSGPTYASNFLRCAGCSQDRASTYFLWETQNWPLERHKRLSNTILFPAKFIWMDLYVKETWEPNCFCPFFMNQNFSLFSLQNLVLCSWGFGPEDFKSSWGVRPEGQTASFSVPLSRHCQLVGPVHDKCFFFLANSVTGIP